MPKRKLNLSESSHAKLVFYRSACLTCRWGAKSHTRLQPANQDGLHHHWRNPDHWVVVRESRPVHSYPPDPNYLFEKPAAELDEPPF